jgi:hypothetical protein
MFSCEPSVTFWSKMHKWPRCWGSIFWKTGLGVEDHHQGQLVALMRYQKQSGKEQVKRMRLLNISTNPRFAEIWGESAKQKLCGENLVFAASMCIYQRRILSVKRARSRDNKYCGMCLFLR